MGEIWTKSDIKIRFFESGAQNGFFVRPLYKTVCVKLESLKKKKMQMSENQQKTTTNHPNMDLQFLEFFYNRIAIQDVAKRNICTSF